MITLLTEVLEEKLSRQSLPEARDAEEIHTLIVQAIVSRPDSWPKGLLPLEVTSDGLMPAPWGLLAATAEKLSPHFLAGSVGDAPVIIRDGTVALHLYRIAQEAVANAAKHSKAKHIIITLSEARGKVQLSISDDGIGYIPRAAHNGGLGLSIMNSRAETINAALQSRRKTEGGTIVTCTIRSPQNSCLRLGKNEVQSFSC